LTIRAQRDVILVAQLGEEWRRGRYVGSRAQGRKEQCLDRPQLIGKGKLLMPGWLVAARRIKSGDWRIEFAASLWQGASAR
jgi:hypothetical protein